MRRLEDDAVMHYSCINCGATPDAGLTECIACLMLRAKRDALEHLNREAAGKIYQDTFDAERARLQRGGSSDA